MIYQVFYTVWEDESAGIGTVYTYLYCHKVNSGV